MLPWGIGESGSAWIGERDLGRRKSGHRVWRCRGWACRWGLSGACDNAQTEQGHPTVLLDLDRGWHSGIAASEEQGK